MASRRRQGRGKQANAEGMHGNRTHKAHIEQLQSGTPEPPDPSDRGATNAAKMRRSKALREHLPGPDGKHRLREDREQHDDADLQSDKNRAAREGVPYSRHEPERHTSSDPRAK